MINPEIKKIIENLIYESPHYNGNELLFNEFLNDILARLAPSLEILKDKIPPQSYLEKVTKKGILNVLKKHQLLTSTKVPDEEKKEIKPNWNTLSFNINKKGEIAFNIPYPASSRENKEIIIEQLKILIKNLEKINENEPEKQFLKIFELKYKENLLIEEIAQKLGLSVEVVSRRLQEMLLKLNEC